MKALGRTTLALLLGMAAAAPAYANTVTCADGTSSEGGRGACSHHGGIAKKDADTESPVRTRTHKAPIDTERKDDVEPAAKAPRTHKRTPVEPERERAPTERETERAPVEPERESAPAAQGDEGPATARCKDGHLSHSKHHTGTCSGHGGVAKWLTE